MRAPYRRISTLSISGWAVSGGLLGPDPDSRDRADRLQYLFPDGSHLIQQSALLPALVDTTSHR